MKKHIVLLLFLAISVLLVCSLAIAGVNPGTGIKQTAHDLSSATGRGSEWDAGVAADPALDRICIYCHAPHHTVKAVDAEANGVDYFPLWNHDFSTQAAPVGPGYTPYTNTLASAPVIPNSIQHQLNADLTQGTPPGQPGGISKLCLSCHDGSVAISSYGNFNGGIASSKHTGSVFATGTRIAIGAGGDLSNHHPIGFDYNAVALADDEIRDSSSVLLGNNPYGLTISDLLYGDKVECGSCHDVHNTKNTGLKFLWVEDTNSNLCFSCHAK
ncbi:MAG: cytochrome c3 family protein [Nitrospirae bacterium]|nr:cytochrome c3 family protein [Nitrospirota bacterium]